MKNRWIEIFKGGKQVSNSGIVFDGDRLIDNAVGKFNPATHEPPITIGHPAENAPAWGWVDGLKKEVKGGVNVLMAKFKEIVPEFEAWVKAGRYKKRSASFYADGSLRHVAFLGAVPPAVKGMENIFNDGQSYSSFILDEETGEEKKMEFSQTDIDAAYERGRKEKDAAMKEAAKEAEKVAKKAAEASFSEEMKRKEAEFAEKERLLAQKFKHEQNRQFVSLAVASGKCLPAWEKSGLVEFMDSLDEKEISFSESDKSSPLEWFKKFLDQFEKHPMFSEFATKKDAAKPEIEDIGKEIAKRAPHRAGNGGK